MAELFRSPASSLHAGPARRGAEARLLADRRARGGSPRSPGRCRACKQRDRRLRLRRALRAGDRSLPAVSRRRSKRRRPATRRLPLRAPRRRSRHERPAAPGQRPQEAFSGPRRPVRPQVRWVYAVDGVSFEVDARRDAVAGRRVRLRQVDGRPRDPAAVRHHRRPGGAGRPAHRRPVRRASCASMRRRVQVVFQDPFSSLNPRMRVRDILAEPIRNFGLAKSAAELEARVAALMDTVRLPRDALGRWPHEFSGGQRQRIGIARALARGARTDRLRRGGLGARRLGQGADRQPAAGSAARVRPRAAVHQPRPRDRRAHDAPRRGDVSRQDRRDGAEAADLRRAKASLHQGAAVGGAGAGARRPAQSASS